MFAFLHICIFAYVHLRACVYMCTYTPLCMQVRTYVCKNAEIHKTHKLQAVVATWEELPLKPVTELQVQSYRAVMGCGLELSSALPLKLPIAGKAVHAFRVPCSTSWRPLQCLCAQATHGSLPGAAAVQRVPKL